MDSATRSHAHLNRKGQDATTYRHPSPFRRFAGQAMITPVFCHEDTNDPTSRRGRARKFEHRCGGWRVPWPLALFRGSERLGLRMRMLLDQLLALLFQLVNAAALSCGKNHRGLRGGQVVKNDVDADSDGCLVRNKAMSPQQRFLEIHSLIPYESHHSADCVTGVAGVAVKLHSPLLSCNAMSNSMVSFHRSQIFPAMPGKQVVEIRVDLLPPSVTDLLFATSDEKEAEVDGRLQELEVWAFNTA